MLAGDLAAAPLNLDSAIEQYNNWKEKDDALEAKSKTAAKLQPILERRIAEFKAVSRMR